jgi:hypothetical protein
MRGFFYAKKIISGNVLPRTPLIHQQVNREYLYGFDSSKK